MPARKVFCVGYNKTGTTSLGAALRGFGYRVGDQAIAEQLMDDWAVRDFRRIIAYCETADAFQDLPFSAAFTFQAVDAAFPGSKFILTVRRSADEWYDSVIRFYQRIMQIPGLPTADDLKRFEYGGRGWLWRQECYVFGIDESTVCDPDIYKAHYERHNARVREYFRFRPGDLLVLDVAEPDAMLRLCGFLGVVYAGQPMPHLNASRL